MPGTKPPQLRAWHQASLAAKLDVALDQRSGEFLGDSEDMKAIKSDARRLASLGRE